MKSIAQLLVALAVLLSFTACNAQSKNVKTETVKIYGNCDMCKATIEEAGNRNKIAKVSWDKDTKMASLTYDAKKTSQDEILKRIALAGYDSDKFLAPDNAYTKLASCCQYTRAQKTLAKVDEAKMKMDGTDHSTPIMPTEAPEVDQMKPVFDSYFAVKDALVQTDGAVASMKSADLLKAIKAVKMEKLSMDVHTVWMKVLPDLQADAQHIADTKDAPKQRAYFMNLSKNMYALMKVSKTEAPTYYQFCPMANDGKGANWLSKDNAIKNPYYGSQMLTCGKTVETIK